MDAELNDVVWRKARRSADNGGACVEIAVLTGRTTARPDGTYNG